MKEETLVRHLEQIEAQAQLLAAAVRTLRLSLSDATPAQVAEPETDENGNCLHPTKRRHPIPAMGQPGRFRCGLCGTVGGTKTVTG